MTTLPIIGISANLVTIDSGCFMGRERTFVGYDYVQAIKEAGGIPIVLPIVDTGQAIAKHASLIDGLVLSGGQDITPQKYGEEPHQLLGAICPQRDDYEIELVRSSHALKKPIFGICRGLQLMNVAFGGTLYQDIHHALPNSQKHVQAASVENATQSLDITEGTILHDLVGGTLILTNTYHHQAIKEVAPGFSVNARAKDGIIEGLEKKGDLFTLGVQWHPELMYMQHLAMRRLFEAFVEAARSQKVS